MMLEAKNWFNSNSFLGIEGRKGISPPMRFVEMTLVPRHKRKKGAQTPWKILDAFVRPFLLQPHYQVIPMKPNWYGD